MVKALIKGDIHGGVLEIIFCMSLRLATIVVVSIVAAGLVVE